MATTVPPGTNSGTTSNTGVTPAGSKEDRDILERLTLPEDKSNTNEKTENKERTDTSVKGRTEENTGDDRTDTRKTEPEETTTTIEEPEETTEETTRTAEETNLYGRELTEKVKGVSKEFPDLFKKHPWARDAIFRGERYSKLFGSVEDAVELVQESRGYRILEQSLEKGDLQPFLKALHTDDGKLKEKVAVRFLPTLNEVDPSTYRKAITPIIQNMIHTAFAEGMQNNNEDLQNAAKWFSKLFFKTSEIPQYVDFKKLIKEVEEEENPEVKRLKDQLNAVNNNVYNNFRSSVDQAADKRLTKIIEQGLDPEKTLSSYVKASLVRDMKEEIDERLAGDAQHIAHMNSLWTRARKNGLTEEAKDSILTAYLSRARNLLPEIRSRRLREALGDAAGNTTTENKGNREEVVDRKTQFPAGSGGGKSGNSFPTAKEANKKGMTDREILELGG